MRNFTILILLLTTVLCGKAQDLLVPCSQLYYGGKTYHELIYKYLIYDNPKQAYAGYIGLWEPYYLVITQYNTHPEPPEYAFVVKDSSIILKRASVNIYEALFAKDRIKRHLLKDYDSSQQKVMKKKVAALKSLHVDRWEMSVSPDFSQRLADLFECVNLTATYIQCPDEDSNRDNSNIFNTPQGARYFNHQYRVAEGWPSSTDTRKGRLNQMADSICYAVEHHDKVVLDRQYIICEKLAKDFKTEIPVCYFTPWCKKSPGLRQPYQVQLFSRRRADFELDINLNEPADDNTVEKYRLLYADSVATWTREAYIQHPFRKLQITLEDTDSVVCHIYIEPHDRVYREICEIHIPADLCRRDIILSTLTLPFGHYHLDSNHRWMPIVQD
jgi:hypothetical protein